MVLKTSVDELIRLSNMLCEKQIIKVDVPSSSLTIRVKAGAEDKLLIPFVVEGENFSPVKIDRLGIYQAGVYRIWVVKE